MKVILCESVINLGEIGQTVKVADGYARNFLLPRKLAVTAESSSAKQIEHEMQKIRRREEKLRGEFEVEAKKLEMLTLEFQARAGEGDKLFGSITTGNIADKLAELGHVVDRRKIVLSESIKSLGIFSVPVRLASGIEASIKVWVTAEEAEEVVVEEVVEDEDDE